MYFSIGKIVIKELLKSIPFVGHGFAAYDAFEKGRDLWKIWKEQGQYRWAGFLVDLESNKHNKKEK